MWTLGPHVALGTDGIGADMFEESRAAYFCEKTHLPAELAARRASPKGRLRGRGVRRVAIRKARSGRSRRPRRSRLRRAGPLRESSFAGHWIFGLSSRHVRDVMVGGEWVVRTGS